MTSIQVNNAARKEQERANKAREQETIRANKAAEAENIRSNKANESIKRHAEGRQSISTLADIWQGIRSGRSQDASRAVNTLGGLTSLVKLLANDPKWYQISPQITSDVASIPAFQPTGTIPSKDDAIGTVKDELNGTYSIMDEGHQFATAGYCHFSYMPTIGNSFYAANNSDGVNITAQNVYSYVRMHNSGAKNYERADYMMYLLAVDAPLSYYAWMKRIYGLLNYANVYNKYLPRHILNDMNVNYGDLSSKIANLRAYINMFATRINASLAIPSEMPYYARHQFLNTYMFSDSRSKKHQLYFFSPRKYFIWKIDPNNQATMLDLENPWDLTVNAQLTLEDIVSFGNYMLETLLNEEDVGLMVGDTIKAFGEEKMAKVPEVPDGYVVEIGTSDEILDQITNIKFAKKNILGYAKISADSTRDLQSIVGYEQLNSALAVTHSYAFKVYQNTTNQQIYQAGNIMIEGDFDPAYAAVTSIWNGTLLSEEVVVANDGDNNVELNFLTDDTSPERVMTSTRLTPTFKLKEAHVIRESGLVKKLTAIMEVTSCGSEVVIEGYTTVLYWDKVNGEAKTATYELFDGMTEFSSEYASTGDPIGTPFTGNDVFISDFDYHPCINIYHTRPSGFALKTDTSPWIRRYTKLWDRNVSTYVAPETLSSIHAAAIMGEFNVAGLGLAPRSKI